MRIALPFAVLLTTLLVACEVPQGPADECLIDAECVGTDICADGVCVDGPVGEGEGEGEVGLTEADVRAALDVDADAAAVSLGLSHGWPVPLADGRHVFVSLRSDRTLLAGDFNSFAPEAMTVVQSAGGFRYAIAIQSGVAAGSRYKFVTGGGAFFADERARLYSFDSNGEMSFVGDADDVDRGAYPLVYGRLQGLDLENDELLASRNVRVLVPAGAATHVLYVHDGQNVFARDSSIPDGYAIPFGGWKLDENTPAGLMIVAIDNTPDRFFDYTHTTEPASIIGGSANVAIGGGGDLYADFIADVVRPAVAASFGEPPVRGVMGSSLGGLISLHVAERSPGAFQYAACLSSTFGWGSFDNVGADDGDDTLIDLVRGGGVHSTVIGLDSGGNPNIGCVDSDGDGIEDDSTGQNEAGDNFCETVQMRETLKDEGYVLDQNLFYDHDLGVSGLGAEHREDAWEFRARTIHVPRFMSMQP